MSNASFPICYFPVLCCFLLLPQLSISWVWYLIAFVLFRLSSLTLGDSERRSSPGQQRETLSDLSSDNTGNAPQARMQMTTIKWSDFVENASVCFIGTGLVQRCVVVQRDNLGFGFTVCGERIKLVQNVRPGNERTKFFCFLEKLMLLFCKDALNWSKIM